MIFRFDRYTLNSETRTLSCGDSTVTLTPKVFQTLLVLVENHARVMSKDELFEHIWPHQTVEEANLTQNISILRKALEEATYGKRFIATFHGHGYRFVEPVEVENVHYGLGVSATPSEPELDRWECMAAPTAPEISQGEEPPRTATVPPKSRRGSLVVAAFVLLSMALVAIGLYLGERHGLRQGVVEPLEVTPLTRMEGAQYQPAWSADAKQLAFIASSPRDESSSIWIQSAGEVRPRQVLTGAGQFSSPAWSPDGKSLAFIHFQQDAAEIVIFSLADSTSRRLTTLFPHRYGLNYRHLCWSPDGRLLAVDDKANENDPLSLYLVYINNGEKLRLTYPNMDIIGDVAPRFSPDGARVAFIRVKYQFVNDVFVLPVAGGEARRLTDQSHLLGDVDWQTKDSLVFSGKLDDAFRFWRLDLRDPANRATLASVVGTDLPLQFSISRQSVQAAFSAYGPDLNIWALDLTKLPSSPELWSSVIRTPGQDIEPSLSPDNTKMAFRSDTSGQMQLWVGQPDGTGASRVDTGTTIPSVYCWTHDGRSLLFASSITPGLFEVSLTSQHALRQIRTDLTLNHPACSADGKSVFAVNRNFLYRVSLLDSASEKITDQGGYPIIPSKDGRYLYFAQGRMDTTISRLDLQTRQQTVVVASLMPGYSDCWGVTSKGILFLTMEARPVIKFHSFATGKETTLAEVSGVLPPVGLSGFSISPDERTLFVVRADPVSANIQATSLAVIMKH
jgi:Tol biopolymer transport system component/DNA-binding winged helix-turn-helix (wHTH) protein